jgi:DNA polymerase III delta prime subunit
MSKTETFRRNLMKQLRAGSHLTLYGPRGSGKSALALAVRDECLSENIPCGISTQTAGLPDVVSALAQAHGDVDVDGLGKRAARARLRLAADKTPTILLLDHTTIITAPMVGFLRRLRGGIAAALLIVDVDSQRERERIDAHASHVQRRTASFSCRAMHCYCITKSRTSR